MSMPTQTHQLLFKKCMYCEVASTNTSHLEGPWLFPFPYEGEILCLCSLTFWENFYFLYHDYA